MWQAECLQVIDDSFSEYKGSRESNKNYLPALRLTFEWLKNSSLPLEELNEMFKWFTSHKKQLYFDAFDEKTRDQAFVIAQSGKIQSLAKLAESSLSASDINSILNNVDSIKELVQIINKIGKMDYIMAKARELLEEKLDFDYLLQIGNNVELVFKEALLQEKINADIIHNGWGSHDFEIKNTENGKSMYVELKSFAYGSNEPFKFAVSQAEKAVQTPNRYAICMIERPLTENENTPDYLRHRLMYKTDISEHFRIALNENIIFNKIRFSTSEVKLYISLKEDVRVSISKKILTDNYTYFKDLITNIISQIN